VARPRKSGKHLPRGMIQRGKVYTYKFRRDGKQCWLRLGNDYGEALRKYADLVGVAHRPAQTIAEALGQYLALRHAELKPDTRAGYAQSAKRLIPVFGALALGELKREHVYRYLTERGNVAANRDRALLSAMYTHFQNAGIFVGLHPCKGMHYRNKERPRTRYVTDAELTAIIAALPRTLALMARWSYLTGMRESDMLALRLTQAGEHGITYTPSKAGAQTLIAWNDDLREIWRTAAGLRIGALPLFATRAGTHYSRDSFQSIWQRWRKKLPVQNVRWHDLRRKTGSDSASAADASELLGHADEKVTRKHYRAKPKTVTPISTIRKNSSSGVE
jgi:integrase